MFPASCIGIRAAPTRTIPTIIAPGLSVVVSTLKTRRDRNTLPLLPGAAGRRPRLQAFHRTVFADRGSDGVFVAASTQCYHELSFKEACDQIVEVGYDKVELWFDREGRHLDAAGVAADPDRFVAGFREMTRLTPIAVCIEDAEATPEMLRGIAKAAKLLRIAQMTVPASPVGTPFNTEIDRLRNYAAAVTPDGIRLSIKTRAGDLTEDPHTAVELCGAVKGLGLTLDPSYYICGPNAGRDWDIVYPYVYHAHVRDTSPESIQVPVGLGEIDYNKLITRLQREKHDPTLSVELLADQTDPETRPLEMRKLRMLLDTLL